jgi:hypothetical protein
MNQLSIINCQNDKIDNKDVNDIIDKIDKKEEVNFGNERKINEERVILIIESFIDKFIEIFNFLDGFGMKSQYLLCDTKI